VKDGVKTALVAALLAVWATPGVARDFPPEVDREAGKIFGSVMSPYCPGKLLGDCPSPAAMQLRETIRERVAAGEPADTIRDEFYEAYGEYIRAAPSAEGFDLLAWVLPFLVIALGAAAIFAWMRRRRASDDVVARPSDVAVDAKTKALLEAELAEMRS
jgi:cytochrome c-type biogenesis protein CcmH